MNKRKICLEESQISLKMLKLNQSAQVDLNSDESVNYERNFNFKLTDKKAKSNLVKSANGRQFEVETKQMSKLFKFSPGAYLQVAKQLAKKCELNFKNNTTIIENGFEIMVNEYREGQELNNKNIDIKIELSVNKQKVVMHCYNTTQNIMINGIGYLNFSDHFLEPLFREQVEVFKSKISEYDNAVKLSLSAKGRPVRAKSVKSVLSVSQQAIFGCKKCDNRFDSLLKLKRHKIAYHSKSLNFSDNSDISIKHSTRNNSFSEEMLLHDNMTLETTDKADENNCDISAVNNMPKHVTEEHVEEWITCDICSENFCG